VAPLTSIRTLLARPTSRPARRRSPSSTGRSDERFGCRNIHRDAIFSATGNTLFAYGNVIELADRNIIIDWRDLPAGFNFKEENWYVVIEAGHYEIVKVIEFDNRAAIFIILKQLIGAPREAIVEIDVQSNIAATQTTSEVVE
jgi:hypothetical protein